MVRAKTILIVDDDTDLVAGLRTVLEKKGYRVLTAGDGNMGLAAAEREGPDLVVVDLMMPRRSGLLVLEKLCGRGVGRPRVIMITAHEGNRQRAYAEALGVDDYIRKPFAMDRLLESVHRLCPLDPVNVSLPGTGLPLAGDCRSMAPWSGAGAVPAHSDFRPLPLLSNPHVQTLLGTWLPGPVLSLPTRVYTVLLPDGDRLVLHETVPARWQPGQPIALLVHGLGGAHNSGYMQRLASVLVPRGYQVVRLDLRGCGRGMPLARGSYNGACSSDVRAALADLRQAYPTSPVVLIGFSLGGNIALKLAGELDTQAAPNLERVAAVSPPIDMERCAALLSLPRNRLYELHFLRGLMWQVRQRQRCFPDLPVVRFPRRMTLRHFDDLHTAPRGGFADALDYYRRASALPLVPRIRVPTFILTAQDDPFIAVEPFQSLEVPPHIQVQIVPRGGHIGFLGWDGAGGIRWAERRVLDWVLHSSPHA